MSYQKGFYGVSYAPEDTATKQLVKSLSSLSKGLEIYGKAAGEELDKKAKADAEKAARIDTFKSYKDAVDSGGIDATKSDFWRASYDNIKGQNAGVEFLTQKKIAFEELIAAQGNNEDLDLDGSGYMQWSQEFDQKYLTENTDGKTSYFMKGLDSYINQANQQLSAKYSQTNATRAKESAVFEFGVAVKNIYADDSISYEDKLERINALSNNVDAFRLVDKDTQNIQAYQQLKNYVAEQLDPTEMGADYETNIKMLEKFGEYKRANGSKFLKGKEEEKHKELILKYKKEHKKYDKNFVEYTQSAEFDATNDAEKATVKNLFFDAKFNKNRGAYKKNGRSIAVKMGNEYDARMRYYLENNPYATLNDKKEYAAQLRDFLMTKGAGVNKYTMLPFDKQQLRSGTPGSSFNVRGRTRDLSESLADYSLVTDEIEINKAYEKLEDKTQSFPVVYDTEKYQAKISPLDDSTIILFKDGVTTNISVLIREKEDLFELETERDTSLIATMAELNGYSNPHDFLNEYEEWLKNLYDAERNGGN